MATLHANRSQNQRLRALQDFKSGRVRVLVATDIAARGIDVEGISHVINYDFPAIPRITSTGSVGRGGPRPWARPSAFWPRTITPISAP